MRDGDTVIVHSMDHLACNLDDLRRLVRTLTGKGVRVEFVKEALTFTGEDSPMVNLVLSVMGDFAEFERALILERQREGIAAAKACGAYTDANPPSPPSKPPNCAPARPPGVSKAELAGSSVSAAKSSTHTCEPTPPHPELRIAQFRPPDRADTPAIGLSKTRAESPVGTTHRTPQASQIDLGLKG